jgi:hypothetical protein
MPDLPVDFLTPEAIAAAAADAAIRDAATLKSYAYTGTPHDDSGLLAAADREHFERELAAIEQASAALRQAEPELESWVQPPSPTLQKPRPVWVLVGALWLSTALVTIGAAYAIRVLVG